MWHWHSLTGTSFTVMVQVRACTESQPIHSRNVCSASGVAVSRTVVPRSKRALQVPGQLMPPSPVTVPPSGCRTATLVLRMVKVTVTALLASMVSSHRKVEPAQAPPQVAGLCRASASSSSVIAVPGSAVIVQVPGQLRRPPNTRPPPPGIVTVSVTAGRSVTVMLPDLMACRPSGRVATTVIR